MSGKKLLEIEDGSLMNYMRQVLKGCHLMSEDPTDTPPTPTEILNFMVDMTCYSLGNWMFHGESSIKHWEKVAIFQLKHHPCAFRFAGEMASRRKITTGINESQCRDLAFAKLYNLIYHKLTEGSEEKSDEEPLEFPTRTQKFGAQMETSPEKPQLKRAKTVEDMDMLVEIDLVENEDEPKITKKAKSQ